MILNRLAGIIAVMAAVTTGAGSSAPAGEQGAEQWPVRVPDAAQHPAELLKLADDFRALRAWGSTDDVPDYAAITAKQERELRALRQRLDEVRADDWSVHNKDDWSVHNKIDYLLLRSQMDGLEFDLKVFRRHKRDPSVYTTAAINNVGRLLTGGRYFRGEAMPYSRERAQAILRALGNTGAFLDQGRANLTEIVPEFADIVMRGPNTGVYFEEAGALKFIDKNYERWALRTAEHFPQPEAAQLVPAAAKAAQELLAFGEWLEQNRPRMTGRFSIGTKAYDWHLRHVLLMPYTVEQLKLMAEIERARTIAYIQFEEQKNRHLPRIEPAQSIQQMQAWDDETALLIRRWYIEDQKILSDVGHMPPVESDGGEYMPPFGWLSFTTEDKPEVERVLLLPEGHHNWVDGFHGWYIDPGTLHGHEYWPGHSLERHVRSNSPCPIRRHHRDGGYSQGWCNYHEDLPVFLDFPYVRGPRARELVHQNILWRSERISLGAKLISGEVTPDQALEIMQANVPSLGNSYGMTRNMAMREVDRMLRQGMDHGQTGRLQILKLLADRKMQLKDEFSLRDFNDQLISLGPVPISLLRWEIAGLDDEVKKLWQARKLSTVIGAKQ